MTTLEEKIGAIRNARDIQSSPGNFDANEYMRGFANGIIFALACIDDETPQYHNPPQTVTMSKIRKRVRRSTTKG